jgi:hypothetical protein
VALSQLRSVSYVMGCQCTRENVTPRVPASSPQFPSTTRSFYTAHCTVPRATTTMTDFNSTDYVTLVSNDGYEFKILRSAACIAGTIKKALDPMCTSSHSTPRLSSTDPTSDSRVPRKHAKPRRFADDQVRSLSHREIVGKEGGRELTS